jgi:ribosomal protein S18 acetylase RimI-like enzyme
MKIIKAELKDLEAAAALFNEYRVFYKKNPDLEGAKKFLRERIENNESVIFLALSDRGDAIGFVQLYPLFSSTGMKRLWLLNDLYVNENFRRMGVGGTLIGKAKQLARETDARGLLLETANDNYEAQSLYIKTGWIKDEDHSYFSWDID